MQGCGSTLRTEAHLISGEIMPINCFFGRHAIRNINISFGKSPSCLRSLKLASVLMSLALAGHLCQRQHAKQVGGDPAGKMDVCINS